MSKKIQIVITTILFGSLVILIGVFKAVSISGPAMEPNYKRGDTFLANKFAYLISKPQRGDVVVFRYSQKPEFKGISRIIGLPNEKLMIKDGSIYINGQVLSEPYVKPGGKTVTALKMEFQQVSETEASLEETGNQKIMDEGQEIKIPENSYFMMGDDRENSIDSRSLGFVEQKDIEGKIFIKYKI